VAFLEPQFQQRLADCAAGILKTSCRYLAETPTATAMRSGESSGAPINGPASQGAADRLLFCLRAEHEADQVEDMGFDERRCLFGEAVSLTVVCPNPGRSGAIT